MLSFKVLFLTLSLLVLTVESGLSGGKKKHSYDLSGSALTNLYNSRVFLAERMRRPLGGWSWMWGLISHSGVRVTLADGSKYLVHKGKNYGVSRQTVVVNARHMSSKWRVVETFNFQGKKTVSDFVKDGGSKYKLIFANCHHASGAMMKQNPKNKKRPFWQFWKG